MDDLMVLCPVYCVYSVLADISIPLGERSMSYLQSDVTRKQRKWEREMQAEEGGGRGGSNARDAKYTRTIFGSTCASISHCVGFTRGSWTVSVRNWFTLLRAPRHRDVPTIRCLWHRNWFIIQRWIQSTGSTTVTQAGYVGCYQAVLWFSYIYPDRIMFTLSCSLCTFKAVLFEPLEMCSTV